jgi:hypothetical protein
MERGNDPTIIEIEKNKTRDETLVYFIKNISPY